jgi:hypothetical protein
MAADEAAVEVPQDILDYLGDQKTLPPRRLPLLVREEGT